MACPFGAISGSRTHSILVATGEHLAVMVIRATRLAAILLRIARGLPHADKGPACPCEWKHVARDSVAAAEPLPYVLRPAVQPLHCSRRRYVILVDSPDCPAMPLQPMTQLRHSGPGRNVHARSRFGSRSFADRVGSGAWRARSARWPLPARRASFLPSRRKPMPRPNWN